ncbi:hypothetical protein RUM43_003397 [Polyplax serrata]|uniref:Uncharacterized protein n=1 Tax=Polyplax serrata TaxID=468196 RepID=A0AAN8NWM0_POLSC
MLPAHVPQPVTEVILDDSSSWSTMMLRVVLVLHFHCGISQNVKLVKLDLFEGLLSISGSVSYSDKSQEHRQCFEDQNTAEGEGPSP